MNNILKNTVIKLQNQFEAHDALHNTFAKSVNINITLKNNDHVIIERHFDGYNDANDYDKCGYPIYTIISGINGLYVKNVIIEDAAKAFIALNRKPKRNLL